MCISHTDSFIGEKLLELPDLELGSLPFPDGLRKHGGGGGDSCSWKQKAQRSLDGPVL